jgi:hypothetical protein
MSSSPGPTWVPAEAESALDQFFQERETTFPSPTRSVTFPSPSRQAPGTPGTPGGTPRRTGSPPSAGFAHDETVARLTRVIDSGHVEQARRGQEERQGWGKTEQVLTTALGKAERELAREKARVEALQEEVANLKAAVRNQRISHEAELRQRDLAHADRSALDAERHRCVVDQHEREIFALRAELKVLQGLLLQREGSRTPHDGSLGTPTSTTPSAAAPSSATTPRSATRRTPLRNPAQPPVHRPLDLSFVRGKVDASLPKELRRPQSAAK